MNVSKKITPDALDVFDAAQRRQQLTRLAGAISAVDERALINMHLHSFFSFNARGWSPSRLVWEARQAGLYAAGLCDFDVLDGLEEFYLAGQILGMRVTVSLETRVFILEQQNVEINSPGEPGVAYIMGAGFPCVPAPTTPAAAMLVDFGHQANQRNRQLVQRVNQQLPEIAIDYDSDVLGLSPGQNPTERHLIRAWRLKAAKVFPVLQDNISFWSKVTRRTPEELTAVASDMPAMEEIIRGALVKRGGIGYQAPDSKSFPPLADFVAWVLDCSAMPMIAWLDGTSAGEQDAAALLEFMTAQGACALNIIPDRNYNIKDPQTRSLKVGKLNEIIKLAKQRELPINIGTEMNKDGQPFADDLAAEVLRPYQEIFLRGARIMVGQSMLARYADFDYAGSAAQAEFCSNTSKKNKLFEAVGSLPPLREKMAERLKEMAPEKALSCLVDSARARHWPITE